VVNISCCNKTCGVVFGMPDHIYEQGKAQGTARPWFCPNGHKQWFLGSEEEKQKRRADAAEAQSSRWRESYNSERKSRIYWQGQAHRKPKVKANG